MIRFLIVPDMLKNAPMFKPKSGAKGLAAGAGKSAMMRAQSKFLYRPFTQQGVKEFI